MKKKQDESQEDENIDKWTQYNKTFEYCDSKNHKDKNKLGKHLQSIVMLVNCSISELESVSMKNNLTKDLQSLQKHINIDYKVEDTWSLTPSETELLTLDDWKTVILKKRREEEEKEEKEEKERKKENNEQFGSGIYDFKRNVAIGGERQHLKLITIG